LKTYHVTPTRIARGGILVLVANVTGLGLRLLFQIILGRTLGPAQYGLYALSLAVVKLLQMPSLIGWQYGVVRFGAMYAAREEREKLKGLIATAFVSVGFLGIFLGACLYLCADITAVRIFSEPDLAPILRIFSILVPILALLIVVTAALRGFHRGDAEIGVREGLQSILRILFGGTFLVLGGGLLHVAWAPVIAATVSLALAFIILKRVYPGSLFGEIKPVFEIWVQYRYVLVLGVIALSGYFLSQIDRLVIGAFRPSAEVGVYNAAALVGLQTGIFLQSLNMMFSPVISDLHARRKMEELNNLFKTVTKWVVTLTFPLTLFVCFSPGHILAIFGNEFVRSDGMRSLVTLAVINFVNVGVGSVGYILAMTGKQNWALLNGIVLGLLNLALNIVFVYYWGIFGAALATGISVALINIARLAEVYWLHGMQPYRWDYLKLVLPAAALIGYWIATGYLIPDSTLTWIAVSVVSLPIYFGVLYLMGLDETDREILGAIKRRLVPAK